MKRRFKSAFVSLVVLFCALISCTTKEVNRDLPQEVVAEESALSAEEEELKALVEQLLIAAGNSDFVALDSMTTDKANLGIAIYRDGEWQNSVSTINEYIDRISKTERKPYYEPVNEYKFLINKGQIAYVWADATLCSFGVPKTNNIDNFTLIKENGVWKFLNASFTNTRLPEEKKKFDLEIFARSYAQVWCSQRPEFVSSFYAEDGLLQVNDGTPAKGKEAITEVAQGFMETFPDLAVSMDSLITNSDKTRFYWTLTGTNDTPNGTGKTVKISGFEEWILNSDGFIQESKGFFDEKEYKRQLKWK